MLFVPTISLILVLGIMSPLVLLTAFLKHLISQVVICPSVQAVIRSSNPACDRFFSVSSHTCDLKIGSPVATLQGTWRDRVSAGTGWLGISIL